MALRPSREISDNIVSPKINMIVMKLFSIFETLKMNYHEAQLHIINDLDGLFIRLMRMTRCKDRLYHLSRRGCGQRLQMCY